MAFFELELGAFSLPKGMFQGANFRGFDMFIQFPVEVNARTPVKINPRLPQGYLLSSKHGFMQTSQGCIFTSPSSLAIPLP